MEPKHGGLEDDFPFQLGASEFSGVYFWGWLYGRTFELVGL